jgi:hypothetical protein
VYKYNFKIDQLVDQSSLYDKYMISVSFALSDLTILNKKIIDLLKEDKAEESVFYFRICLGFMREAYMLLENIFENNTFKVEHLEKIPQAIEKYNEICNIINSKPIFKASPINENRHRIFHYPKKDKDLELLSKVLEDFKHEKFQNSFTFSDNFCDNSYPFAELLQLNMLYDTYKIHSYELKKYETLLSELDRLTRRIINLLKILWINFVESKNIHREIVEPHLVP